MLNQAGLQDTEQEVYVNRKEPDLELTSAIMFNVLYQQGKIYVLEFEGGYKYVGLTCRELEDRIKEHMSCLMKTQAFKKTNR